MRKPALKKKKEVGKNAQDLKYVSKYKNTRPVQKDLTKGKVDIIKDRET